MLKKWTHRCDSTATTSGSLHALFSPFSFFSFFKKSSFLFCFVVLSLGFDCQAPVIENTHTLLWGISTFAECFVSFARWRHTYRPPTSQSRQNEGHVVCLNFPFEERGGVLLLTPTSYYDCMNGSQLFTYCSLRVSWIRINFPSDVCLKRFWEIIYLNKRSSITPWNYSITHGSTGVE